MRGRDPEDACTAGISLISPAQRDEALRRGNVGRVTPLFVLEGGDLSGREPFFNAIARTLAFPDYFGHNWDAVYDCLTDPSVMPANGTVLVLDGFEAMAMREPEQWAIALTVLREACAFWRPLSTGLVVRLVGPAELAPGVEPLPAHCFES